MSRMISKKYVFLMVALSILLVGCQQQESTDTDFQILVFSNIEGAILDDIKGQTKTGMDIAIFPPVAERLVMEIVQHSGDLFIMDRELLATAYDDEELYSLDEFRTLENTIELTEFEIVALQAAGEKVEIGDTYLNALRILQTADANQDFELVVIIPKYTEYPEVAFSIVEKIVQ